MENTNIKKVPPLERFRVRTSGKLISGSWPVRLDRVSKFYYCPECGERTLIRWSNLDVFNPQQSVFPDEIQAKFSPVKGQRETYDFYCRGCSRPIRLIFWAQERGMGGYWYPFIIEVHELVEEMGKE